MLDAVALAVASAAGIGAADFVGGLAARRSALSTVTLTSLWAATAVLLPVVLLVRPSVSASGAGWAAGSGVMTAAAVPLTYEALACGPMSLVAPITSSSAILPAAVGVARGALVGPATGLGLALTFVGVLVVARAAPHREKIQRVKRRGLALALGASVAIGGSVALLQAAASSRGGSALTAALIALATAALAATLVRPFFRRQPARPRAVTRLALVAGAATGGGIVLLCLASRPPDVTAVVAVLNSLYSVWTILLARFLLRERLSRAQAGGVVCALLGVAIVSAA